MKILAEQLPKVVFCSPMTKKYVRTISRFLHTPCTHAYASAHTLLRTYAKDRQSVPVHVDNATVGACSHGDN
jgi:hypothetical protein